jgi:phosphatidate cytidylyltransferase
MGGEEERRLREEAPPSPLRPSWRWALGMSPRQIRFLIGSVLLAAAGGIFAIDALLCTRAAVSLAALCIGLAGYLEFARLSGLSSRERGGDPLLGLLGLLATLYFLLGAWLLGGGDGADEALITAGLLGFLLLGFAALIFRRDFLAAFPALKTSFLGVVLFGLFFSYVIRAYGLDPGDPTAGLVRGVVLFLGVKGTDITAYLAGSAIGRHHFLEVSPKKTLEGSIAALIFGALWFSGAAIGWPQYFFEWPWALLFGIILSIASQLGDLTESLIKRNYRVKDSGALLPEFGGVLDLIDSFLFSGFIFWCALAVSWK